MSIKDNMFYKRIVEAMEPMEGLGGPDPDEYIRIMAAVVAEASERIANASAQLGEPR